MNLNYNPWKIKFSSSSSSSLSLSLPLSLSIYIYKIRSFVVWFRMDQSSRPGLEKAPRYIYIYI